MPSIEPTDLVARVEDENNSGHVIMAPSEKPSASKDAELPGQDKISVGRYFVQADEQIQQEQDDCGQLQVSASSSSFDNDQNKATFEPTAKRSKLRKATRAILLFRRATATKANEQNCRRQSTSKVHQLAASFSNFWRQNNNGHTSAGRCNVATSKSSNQISGKSSTNLATGNEQSSVQQKQNSHSNTCLPRFIVPRMNALKLPIVCRIRSLDGELMREIFVHRYEVGQYLIDNLKVSLNIKDAKYFGLKVASSLDDQDNVKLPWLDLTESVCKQISKFGQSQAGSPLAEQQITSDDKQQQFANLKFIDFYLRIKYYPPNLARVQDPFLRQYLFLQLRRDLRLGKLTSSINNLTLLMACVLQYELGDYDPQLVGDNLCALNILPNQDMIEQQALTIWQKRLVGLKRHQVQMQFLRASVILETYGFDYYPVRDHQLKRGYLLGFNYAGVKTIRNGRIAHHFRWNNLSKVAYERRMIIFHIYPNESSKRKGTLGFKCLSNDECHNLYMRLLEQKYFFTVDLAYFDKSIRRPSYLTDCSLNGQSEQVEWPTPTSLHEKEDECENIGEFEAPRPQQRAGCNTAAQQQQQHCTKTKSATARTSLEDTRAEASLERAERNDDDDEEEDDDDDDDEQDESFTIDCQMRTSNLTSGSNSFESTQFDSEPTSSSRNTANNLSQPHQTTFDDCPDCIRAQLERSFLSNVAPTPILKSSSMQEPITTGCQPSYSQQLARYSTYSTTPLAPPEAHREASLATGRLRNRASLQRQRSTSNSPGASFDLERQQQQQPPQQVDTLGAKLASWIESICASSSNGPRVADVERQQSRHFFAQAIRFCLLIVVMNLLVHLSDFVSTCVIELLSFKTSSAAMQHDYATLRSRNHLQR